MRLQGGELLPSSRELARELGVSRGLVQECYSRMRGSTLGGAPYGGSPLKGEDAAAVTRHA